MGNFSTVKAAVAYDFALKLFSLFMSISLDSKEKLSAIASLVMQVLFYK
jgi:hypothetical protein